MNSWSPAMREQLLGQLGASENRGCWVAAGGCPLRALEPQQAELVKLRYFVVLKSRRPPKF